MTRKILIGVLIVAVVGALVTAVALSQYATPSVDVMAGSSFITNIIQDVAEDKVEARTFIPPGVCPGHYDAKPSDIAALTSARAFFIHNYQQNYQNVVGAIEAAENPDLIVTVINITGNWMVPMVQIEGVNEIARALGETYPEDATYFEDKAAERAQAILAKGETERNRLLAAGVADVQVICAAMQAGFVNWAGFNITATFGRPEDLSATDVDRLITKAQQAGAALVIDNLQSGSTTLGASMEQDIEAIPVTLSNFPGGLEDTDTWEKAIEKNVNLLLEAFNEWKEQHG